MRGEFLLIQTAFDSMPRITTTGLFDSVFNQLGNFTFTLPGAPGTIATTANITTETTRALAAEAVVATAVGTEATARIAADASEAAARTAAIGVETTRATAAEGVNATAITAETTRATAAEATKATPAGVATAVATETARALAAEAAGVVVAADNIGRNLLHNAMFRIQQRGAGPWAVSGYTVDRWRVDISLDSTGVFLAPLGVTGVLGDEEAATAIQLSVSGNVGAGALTIFDQFIENAKRLSGKTITVSFGAAVLAGTAKVGVGISQFMGTGGSPSAQVDVNATPITLTTTPTRYSVTIAVPSLAGKTLGTNGDHSTRLGFFFSSGATNNTLAGGIGVQAANFILEPGVQLEVGAVASPLEKPDIRYDLANCQRFYQAASVQLGGYGAAGSPGNYTLSLPVQMRVAPTITPTFSTQTNCGSSAIGSGAAGLAIATSVTATGPYQLFGSYTASADL